jgi:tripartite ATP-independent transporter DctM subunit
MLLMSGLIVAWGLITKPDVKVDEGLGFRAFLQNSRGLIPVVVLIVAVIGSIYRGIATPTEAAAVGVIGALGISAASRTLTWPTFVDSVRGATRTSCMIGFIVAAASFLTVAISYAGIPDWIARGVANSGLSPYQLIAVLTLVFIVLGCFLDGVSIIILATSLLLPTVTHAGFDLIWFGVYLVLVVEMSMVTPPIGLNLFVAQALTKLGIGEIARGALPFFLILVGFVAVLVAFPEIATYLPSRLNR